MKTITLPLKDYLEQLLGSRERSCVSSALALELSLADPQEELFHLEPVDNEAGEPKLFWLWSREGWDRVSRRHDKHNQVRQALLELENQRLQTVELLARKLELEAGIPSKDARALAFQVVDKKNLDFAQDFGFTLDQLVSQNDINQKRDQLLSS